MKYFKYYKAILILIAIVVSAIIAYKNYSNFTTRLNNSSTRTNNNENNNQDQQNPDNYSLSSLKIMNKVLAYVKDEYLDQGRIDWNLMLLSGLDYVQNSIAEVLVIPVDEDQIKIQVGAVERIFQIREVNSSWRLLHKFREIFAFIEENIDKTNIKLSEIEYAAINGILKTLDPHSILLKPDFYREMKLGTTGEFGGLGIVISIRNEELTIISPIDDTPAANAGLKAMDRIVQIEDLSTVNMTITEAVNLLRGAPGTEVKIWVMRNGWDEPREFTLQRAIIRVESIAYRMLSGNVGYIRLKSFQSNTLQDLVTALENLQSQGMKGIVLDLRNNPGGLLEQAVSVADVFLKSGIIVTTAGSNTLKRTINMAHDDGIEPDCPIVILVNEGSASAAEIVAGALRNNGLAVVMGKRTFGKGSVQILYEFEDGSALKLTTAEYLTPGGISIQSIGINPDIELRPVILTRNFIDMVKDEDEEFRENDLESHLEYRGHVEQYRTVDTISYYEKVDEENNNEDNNENNPLYNENEIKIDYPINVAKNLILSLPRNVNDRENILKNSSHFIENAKNEQSKVISDRLKTLGVNWDSGADQGQTDLKVSINVNDEDNDNKIEAGEKVKLIIDVTNQGKAPVYKLHGVTKSDNLFFKEREFVWGRILPGETRSWYVEVLLPQYLPSRNDPLNITFDELYNHIPPPAHTTVEIDGLLRPEFAYSYQFVDSDGDGIISKGEQINILLKVKNQGAGKSYDTLAILRNESGKGIFIKQGRFDLSKLEPNKVVEKNFVFDVKNDITEPLFKLTLGIVDIDLKVSSTETIEVKVSDKIPTIKSSGFLIDKQGHIPIYESPQKDAHLIGYSKQESSFNIQGFYQDYYQIKLNEPGQKIVRNGWVAKTENINIEEKVKEVNPVYDDVWDNTPPKIVLDSEPLTVNGDKVKLSGKITDEDNVLDMYIFVGEKKYFYKVNAKTVKNYSKGEMSFEAILPLEQGANDIYITARENNQVGSSKRLVIRRNAPDGTELISKTKESDDQEL